MGKQRKTKRRRALIAARSATVMLNDTQHRLEDTFGGKTITVTPTAELHEVVARANEMAAASDVILSVSHVDEPVEVQMLKNGVPVGTITSVDATPEGIVVTTQITDRKTKAFIESGGKKPVPFSDRLKDAYQQHDGLITDDIVSMFPDVPRSSITARISDLKKRGLIVSPNVHRDDKQGRPVDVYFWAGE